MKDWIATLVPKHQKPLLHDLVDLDFAFTSDDGYRFRINLFRQRQNYGLVLRVINSHTKTMEELQLPKSYAQFRQGTKRAHFGNRSDR